MILTEKNIHGVTWELKNKTNLTKESLGMFCKVKKICLDCTKIGSEAAVHPAQ